MKEERKRRKEGQKPKRQIKTYRQNQDKRRDVNEVEVITPTWVRWVLNI